MAPTCMISFVYCSNRGVSHKGGCHVIHRNGGLSRHSTTGHRTDMNTRIISDEISIDYQPLCIHSIEIIMCSCGPLRNTHCMLDKNRAIIARHLRHESSGVLQEERCVNSVAFNASRSSNNLVTTLRPAMCALSAKHIRIVMVSSALSPAHSLHSTQHYFLVYAPTCQQACQHETI